MQGEERTCIKNEKSKGVCTISSCSNGPRQDWVACPYRLIAPDLVSTVAARLYAVSDAAQLRAYSAPALASEKTQSRIRSDLAKGLRVFTYFDQKLGGEISLSGTAKSPEMAFDVTLVEFVPSASGIDLGRFAILEVQTMDFHGSYSKAVTNLRTGLGLHPKNFPTVLQENLWWAGERVEGPNIANVFKRTFYQMAFKFRFAENEACAGTALVLPQAVWDSWQPFLGAPLLVDRPDGSALLTAPSEPKPSRIPAWIYVADFDSASRRSPSPTQYVRPIGVTAGALTYYALHEAPGAATAELLSDGGIYASLRRRLRSYWSAESFAPAL